MPARARLSCLTMMLLALPGALAVRAQGAAETASERVALPSGIDRIAGTEPASKIQYVRLISYGTPFPVPATAPDAASRPMLIGQCTLRPSGKYFFELFTNFGDVTDLAFYPPWKPASPQDTFAPKTYKVNMTMEFLGYTKVKPIRRQWEIPAEIPGQYRYNPPGSTSSNLEEIPFHLRFMLALPTLHLTPDSLPNQTGRHTLEFLTAPLLAEIQKEPLCKGALL